MASSSGTNRRILGSEDSISEHLTCPICLDLTYEPTVLACGHVFCFGCLHISMKEVKASRCAMCLDGFEYLPRPCSLLHDLLLKIYPNNYRKKYEESEDKKMTCYGAPVGLSSERSHSGSSLPENIPMQVHLADVLCAECEELLYQPIVLKCGHAFCKSCQIQECAVCYSPHLEKSPKVCLCLDQFLAEQLPNEYNRRMTRIHETESFVPHAMDVDRERLVRLPRNFHPGVGCDSCGIYPLEGKRYRCLDCRETTGYDLCELCYVQDTNHRGRFNQNHNSEHILAVDGTMLFRD